MKIRYIVHHARDWIGKFIDSEPNELIALWKYDRMETVDDRYEFYLNDELVISTPIDNTVFEPEDKEHTQVW